MSRWKVILSLLCLAIWLPATQHCRLEGLLDVSFLQCAGETEADCQGDSCVSVERGVYKAPDSSEIAAAFMPVQLEILPALRDSPDEVTFAPGELISGGFAIFPEKWQAYSVAAAPIRGPSILC